MRVLKVLVLLALLQLQVHGQEADSSIHFGIIADIQYADKDDHGSRYYRKSLEKLDTAIAFINRQNVEFTIAFGDFVDQGIKDLPPVIQRLEELHAPVYNMLGNHDYVAAPEKEYLYRHFKMEAPYYTFDKGNWQFIVLNTNELSEYATDPGTSLREEWQAMSENLKEKGRKNARAWNGGIGKEQLHWLRTQLTKAEREAKNVLILTHHPLFPENGLEALNNREILELITQYTCVRAVISGHHHEGNFAYYKNIPIVTLEGMIETTNQNAFGTIKLDDHRIEISGQGRLTSRGFDF